MGTWGIMLTLVATWYLTGLSITVWLVVYPAFEQVGAREWQAYHAAHMRRILPAVGPMWLVEAIGLLCWLAGPPPGTLFIAIICAVGALSTVVLTATSAVPAHAALSAGYERRVWQRLQRGHAQRTLAWALAALMATLAAIAQLK